MYNISHLVLEPHLL